MQNRLTGLVLGGVLVLAGWGNAQAADYTIRLAHSLSTSEPAHLAAEYFAANVNERSEGRIEIEVFPGEQLGSGKDVNEMIRQGANVMNITDPGYLSDYVPDVGVLNGPYLLADYRDFQKILDSEWLAEIDQQLIDAGIRVVSYNNLFGASAHAGRHGHPHARRHRGRDRARAAEPDVARHLRGDGCQADHGAVVRGLHRPLAERGRCRRGAAGLALGLEAARGQGHHLDDRALHRLGQLHHERAVLRDAP